MCHLLPICHVCVRIYIYIYIYIYIASAAGPFNKNTYLLLCRPIALLRDGCGNNSYYIHRPPNLKSYVIHSLFGR
jgi:hypothetical protein